MKVCPSCGSSKICKSRRWGFVERKLFKVVFVRPFRCLICDDRFYVWSLFTNPQASRQVSPLSPETQICSDREE
jgi:hypothetical protein